MVDYNESCQLECTGNRAKRPQAALWQLDCVMMTAPREFTLAEITHSLSVGRGPFHRHEEHLAAELCTSPEVRLSKSIPE